MPVAWFGPDENKQASSGVLARLRDRAEGAIGPRAFLLGGGKNGFDSDC